MNKFMKINYIILTILMVIITNCENEIDYIYKTGDVTKLSQIIQP